MPVSQRNVTKKRTNYFTDMATLPTMAARKRRTSEPSNSNSRPSLKKTRKAPGLSPIPWAADDSVLVWKLLGELEKTENYKVLFGKKTQHKVDKSDRC